MRFIHVAPSRSSAAASKCRHWCRWQTGALWPVICALRPQTHRHRPWQSFPHCPLWQSHNPPAEDECFWDRSLQHFSSKSIALLCTSYELLRRRALVVERIVWRQTYCSTCLLQPLTSACISNARRLNTVNLRNEFTPKKQKIGGRTWKITQQAHTKPGTEEELPAGPLEFNEQRYLDGRASDPRTWMGPRCAPGRRQVHYIRERYVPGVPEDPLVPIAHARTGGTTTVWRGAGRLRIWRAMAGQAKSTL